MILRSVGQFFDVYGPPRSEAGIATPTRTGAPVSELERVDEPLDESDWWCVRTKPFPCPAPGCEFVAHYLTAAHAIIVWPERDDRDLLSYANDAQAAGREPEIVRYDDSMGFCLSFARWVQLGCPVHGKRSRPDGTPGFRRL